jgi:cell division protein FtsW
MSAPAILLATPTAADVGRSRGQHDYTLIALTATLLLFGLVMMGSASVAVADRLADNSAFFFHRQLISLAIGLSLAFLILQIPLVVWERSGPMWMIASLVLLAAILIPGIGQTVNGSTRWLRLLGFQIQVSELAKLAFIIYIAGYLVRRAEQVETSVAGFMRPMLLVAVAAILLLAEPDYGATVVLTATALGMLFLAGVRLWIFGVMTSGVVVVLSLIAIAKPYRLQRLGSFRDPWADAFNDGFQLTQALIAFGRGEWFGVGLGASIQKLFYLPEAHTDFVFSVVAEELGMVGAAALLLLFAALVVRIFQIGSAAARCGHYFSAHLCNGIALWIALQVVINMGVNTGLLPTKGLTLPMISYGGSSLLVMCAAIALVSRVAYETPRRGAVRSQGGAV